MKRRMLLLVLTLLGACATAPRVAYYVLEPAPQALSSTPSRPAVLSVRLAGYLSAQNMVYRQSAVQVSQAQFHQWAEPPARMLQSKLAAHLSTLPVSWLEQSRGHALPALQVDFESFNGSHSGFARLTGQYRLYAADGSLLLQRPFDLQVAQQGDGYAALARALSLGVAELADQIAATLKTQPALSGGKG